MTDWTDFRPDAIPHPNADNENSTDSDSADYVDGVRTSPTIGPNKVFKNKFPIGKPVEMTATWERQGMKIRNLTATKDVELLRSHGVVAVGSEILEVAHPADQTLVESIIKEEAFVVTPDLKMVDISAHATWPIDLDKAVDVRATINTPVKYGDSLARIAAVTDDITVIEIAGQNPIVVPMQDTIPVMLAKKES